MVSVHYGSYNHNKTKNNFKKLLAVNILIKIKKTDEIYRALKVKNDYYVNRINNTFDKINFNDFDIIKEIKPVYIIPTHIADIYPLSEMTKTLLPVYYLNNENYIFTVVDNEVIKIPNHNIDVKLVSSANETIKKTTINGFKDNWFIMFYILIALIPFLFDKELGVVSFLILLGFAFMIKSISSKLLTTDEPFEKHSFFRIFLPIVKLEKYSSKTLPYTYYKLNNSYFTIIDSYIITLGYSEPEVTLIKYLMKHNYKIK